MNYLMYKLLEYEAELAKIKRREDRLKAVNAELEAERRLRQQELEQPIEWDGEIKNHTSLTQSKNPPTCSTRAIHKLIEYAFYSINKPASEIVPEDVMEALQRDHEQQPIDRKIDKLGTIIEISGESRECPEAYLNGLIQVFTVI